jgi:hypothetical protein
MHDLLRALLLYESSLLAPTYAWRLKLTFWTSLAFLVRPAYGPAAASSTFPPLLDAPGTGLVLPPPPKGFVHVRPLYLSSLLSLRSAGELSSLSFFLDKFVPLLLGAMHTAPAALKTAAAHLYANLMLHTPQAWRRADLHAKLLREFAASRSYLDRTLFVQLCKHLLGLGAASSVSTVAETNSGSGVNGASSSRPPPRVQHLSNRLFKKLLFLPLVSLLPDPVVSVRRAMLLSDDEGDGGGSRGNGGEVRLVSLLRSMLSPRQPGAPLAALEQNLLDALQRGVGQLRTILLQQPSESGSGGGSARGGGAASSSVTKENQLLAKKVQAAFDAAPASAGDGAAVVAAAEMLLADRRREEGEEALLRAEETWLQDERHRQALAHAGGNASLATAALQAAHNYTPLNFEGKAGQGGAGTGPGATDMLLGGGGGVAVGANSKASSSSAAAAAGSSTSSSAALSKRSSLERGDSGVFKALQDVLHPTAAPASNSSNNAASPSITAMNKRRSINSMMPSASSSASSTAANGTTTGAGGASGAKKATGGASSSAASSVTAAKVARRQLSVGASALSAASSASATAGTASPVFGKSSSVEDSSSSSSSTVINPHSRKFAPIGSTAGSGNTLAAPSGLSHMRAGSAGATGAGGVSSSPPLASMNIGAGRRMGVVSTASSSSSVTASNAGGSSSTGAGAATSAVAPVGVRSSKLLSANPSVAAAAGRSGTSLLLGAPSAGNPPPSSASPVFGRSASPLIPGSAGAATSGASAAKPPTGAVGPSTRARMHSQQNGVGSYATGSGAGSASSFGLHHSGGGGSLSDRSERERERARADHGGASHHHHSASLSFVPSGIFDVSSSGSSGGSSGGAIAGRRQVRPGIGGGSSSAASSSSSYLPKLDAPPASSSSSLPPTKLYAHEPPAHAHARKFKLSQRSQLPSADVLRSETNAIKAAVEEAQQQQLQQQHASNAPMTMGFSVLATGAGMGGSANGASAATMHNRLRSLSSGAQPSLLGLKPSPREHRK